MSRRLSRVSRISATTCYVMLPGREAPCASRPAGVIVGTLLNPRTACTNVCPNGTRVDTAAAGLGSRGSPKTSSKSGQSTTSGCCITIYIDDTPPRIIDLKPRAPDKRLQNLDLELQNSNSELQDLDSELRNAGSQLQKPRFAASKPRFAASRRRFEASNPRFEASKRRFGASRSRFEASKSC